MNIKVIEQAIEAILFASGEPISISQLCEVLEIDDRTLTSLVQKLNDKYVENENAFQILTLDEDIQMCTRKEFASYIKKALDISKNIPLSQAAMEVLAIIAYNQPVSKSFIEQIRGIESSNIVNNLVVKGLVEEAGRLDIPGKPIGYITTSNFLRSFGISSLDELPPLPNAKLKEGELDELTFDDAEIIAQSETNQE
ncbi:MAG: SMC-Scp complex subunit ScpB [Oscillospiraceae bacterium]|nr:SMC-Scp complex subunit ScpB [Oscillospiraceae bacterium]